MPQNRRLDAFGEILWGRVGTTRMHARTMTLLSAATFVVAAGSARGESIAACAEAGAPFATVTAKVARDGATIQLNDGREVRLAGVVAANDLDGDDSAVRAATAALARLVSGRTLALHGRSDTDRYGRLVAQVAVVDSEPNWLQALLITEGILRVAPEAGEPACSGALLALEQKARAARTGIWAEPRFALQKADDLATLNAASGRFAVVEGTVTRVGEVGGRLFLDFGRRYLEDFTLVVARDARPAFDKAGIDLKALKGKTVRARGVLYPWGGPAIELRKPAALEIVAGGGT
jgi:endonuclease YncB( thermonuclease family)